MESYTSPAPTTTTRRTDSNKCWRALGKGALVHPRWEGKDKTGALESVGDFTIHTKSLHTHVFTAGLLLTDKKQTRNVTSG